MEPTQFLPSNTHDIHFYGIAVGAACQAFTPGALALTGNDQAKVGSHCGRLPLIVDTNLDQTAIQVGLPSRDPGNSLFQTPREAVLSLKKLQGSDQPPPSQSHAKSSPSSTQEAPEPALCMQLVEANHNPKSWETKRFLNWSTISSAATPADDC